MAIVEKIIMFLRLIKLTKKLLSVLSVGLLVFAATPSVAYTQADYSCGTYGSGAYNENCIEDTQQPPSGAGDTGMQDGNNKGGNATDTLSGTGSNSDIYGIVGVTFIFASIVLLWLSKKNTRK